MAVRIVRHAFEIIHLLTDKVNSFETFFKKNIHWVASFIFIFYFLFPSLS